MQKYWIHDNFFQSKICILKNIKYSNFRLYWNVISAQLDKHTIFYKIVRLIFRLFDVHFAIQGFKMAKNKELSRDMRDRIIEHHKGGQGYRKMSKEMNLALSIVGSIIRKYKKYGDGMLHFDLRPGQTFHSKVMHRKEVTHSSNRKKSRRRIWLTKWDKVKAHDTLIDWCTGREWPLNCMIVISAWWRSNMPFKRLSVRLSGRWTII